MNRFGLQRGYILLPVTLAILLVASIAYLLNNQSAMNVDMTGAAAAGQEVQQIAESGLAHAVWGAQDSVCAGDMAMTTVPFGAGNYSATVDSAATTTVYAPFVPDRDTYIREDNPDANKGGDSVLSVENSVGGNRRAMYHFDLSSIPNTARVASATVWLYVTANDPQVAVNLHPITTAWTEAGATWNNMAGSFDSAVFGVISPQPAAGAWVSINLTALTQSWVNDATANHGVMLISPAVGIESDYTSKEYGTASQRPYLQITTAVGEVSPLAITATGTLTGNPSPANDIARTLTRTDVPAYQPPGYSFLQLQAGSGKDAMLDGFYNSRNHGDYDLGASSDPAWLINSLVQFDLPAIPAGARVLSAELQLYHNYTDTAGADAGADVHRVNRDWVEGTKAGTGTADGATWDTWDGSSAWTTAGGDYDASAVAGSSITAATGDWASWDITTLAQGWLDGSFPNNGLLLKGTGTVNVGFASKENTDPALHPRLNITYACECGSPCMAPQGSGNVLMVVQNASNPDAHETLQQALLESWGYSVELISDNASPTAFDTAFGTNDVVYMTGSADPPMVDTKLTNAPIGVVSNNGGLNDELGISSTKARPIGTGIDVIDTSHYITVPFASGGLSVYSAAMKGLTATGTLAPGLQTLAQWGTDPTLAILDQGATLVGGGTAAARRVILPFGGAEGANLDWRYVNSTGRLILQRALQWGIGNTGGPSGPNLLLVVVNPSSLTTQESAKKALIESWGYTITLIDDDATQATFDTAFTAAQVVYVSAETTNATLGTKLRNAPIGVVNERGPLMPDLGISGNSGQTSARTTINVNNNTHYLTDVWALGLVTITTSSQSLTLLGGQKPPDLLVLADEEPTSSANVMAVLDTGGALYGGGTAPARRVELPWGPVGFDINSLNADGQGLMQRAIEWAEGASCGSITPLLLVVSDDAAPTSQETARQALIESWCYAVTLIDDDATSGEVATAMGLNDVIYISQEITTLTVVTKLKDANIGIVNEEYLISSGLGFGSGTGSGFYNDINLLDNTHYITSGFGLGALALFSPTNDIYTGTGFTLAPGAQVLGQTGSITGLMALETGGALWDSGVAAGRRVLVPWGDDFNALNADGQTIMQRAIEWAGTVPENVYDVLLVVANAASPSTRSVGRQDLLESWGYMVTLIDDGDSQANFDAAMAANDVVYVTDTVSGPTLLDKVTNTTTPVVNEKGSKLGNFGFSSSESTTVNASTFDSTDVAHYITAPFGGGSVTVLTSSMTMSVPGGTLAPDMQVAGEVSGGPALATLDTGATLHSGGSAPARRAHLPLGAAETTQLTADGETIMQRAIEWAAGAGAGEGSGGGGPTGVVFEEFTERKYGSTAFVENDKPPGTAEGDLLIATVATDGSTAGSMVPPAGWTMIDLANQSGAVTYGVWWKLAGASEPATYTFSWSGSEHAYATIMRFTGHDAADPIDVSAVVGGSSSAPTSPAVTTTVADTMILRLGGFDDDDITTDAPGLTGHTAITMDDSGNGPATTSSGAGYVLQPAAGDSGTSTFALTGSEQYRTVTIAIAPAP